MKDLKKEELLKVLREVFETKRMDLQSLFYDIPEKEFYERKKKLNAAEGQIRALIQGPGKKRGLIGMAGEIFNEVHKNQPQVTEE